MTKTCDGENEEELCGRFNQLIDTEKATALAACVLSPYDKYIQYAGYGVTAIGVIMLFAGLALFGVLAIIAGVAMVLNYMSKAKRIETSRANIEAQFEQKRTSGLEILRATLAGDRGLPCRVRRKGCRRTEGQGLYGTDHPGAVRQASGGQHPQDPRILTIEEGSNHGCKTESQLYQFHRGSARPARRAQTGVRRIFGDHGGGDPSSPRGGGFAFYPGGGSRPGFPFRRGRACPGGSLCGG